MSSIDSVAALYVVLATLTLAALSSVLSRATFAFVYALWLGVQLLHLGLVAGWAALLVAVSMRRTAAAVEEVVAFALFSISFVVQIVKQSQLLNMGLDFELLRAAVAAQLLSTWEVRVAHIERLKDADPAELASLLFVWRVRLVAAPTLAPTALWFRLWQLLCHKAASKWEPNFGRWLMDAWLDDVLNEPTELYPRFGAWEVWQLGNSVTEERAAELLVKMTTPPPAAETTPADQRMAGAHGGAAGAAATQTVPANNAGAVSSGMDPGRDPILKVTGVGVYAPAFDGHTVTDPAGPAAPAQDPEVIRDAVAESVSYCPPPAHRQPSSRELFLTYVLAAVNMEALANCTPSCSLVEAADGASGPLAHLYKNTQEQITKRWRVLYNASPQPSSSN
ncbi:hypothetical protein I4F81_000359 [Pyropia yezoensis]|uniref:Uncharacterized protein n=1 Tax=Pyropia yezoensis TaxID=2788 RepID=A0ACC3BIH6_PYRYE|nr:hypothetical protein I4F81_000359 [Neopyropia yezoensis]